MEKKKKILIFQTGETTHLDLSAAPMRLINLADKLLKYNYEIIILTPLFYHQEKKFRDKKLLIKNKEIKVKYIFIESPGYKKNISLKRLYDHIILAKNLREIISNISEIDYVFMGFPPIEACFVLANWCKKKKIPYIVDYKDQWPELFTYKKNIFIKVILIPLIFILKLLRNYTLINSSAVSTISNQFLDNLNLDNIQNKKIVCYLTKKKSKNINFKCVGKDIRIKFPSEKIKIVFIGNFMINAFDFKIILKIKQFIENSQNLEIYFFGDGPSKIDIVKSHNFRNIFIGGRVNSHEFQYIMQNSQGVFLPINNRFDYLKSLPNKVVDAIQYKLPIFTSLHGETEFIIKKYNVGFVYRNELELLNHLKWFCKHNNHSLIVKNYENSKLKELFDHELNYEKIVNKINCDLNVSGF